MTNLPHQPDDRRLTVLTERKREVLALVGRRLSNVDISGPLLLDPSS